MSTGLIPSSTLTSGRLRNDLSVLEWLRQETNRAPVSLPLTPFDPSNKVDLAGFRAHLHTQLAARPGAVVVCSGMGEFPSLSLSEYDALVRTAVEVAAGRVPVLAGIGYRPALALGFAGAAVRAGADAGLVMLAPFASAPDEGVVNHLRQLSAGTDLPILFSLETGLRLAGRTVQALALIPRLIGVVDLTGDVAQAQRLRLMAPPHWLFLNGAASAELSARPYASIGIRACASSVHSFAPEIAHSFFLGMCEDDEAWIEELLREFFLPLAELSAKHPGYEIALPKAAARLRGASMGSARPPVSDPTQGDLRQLDALLDRGLRLVAAD
jgi:5-dehydro-4-deoxyglucarate dehydratase